MRHMKKLFILFLIIVLAMICFTTVSASDETELVSYPVTGGRILFDSEAGIVTGYEGAITKVDIPSKINGVDVVTIGNGAFNNCISLSSVVLPDSLTTIEEFAFANCFFLTSVELPDSLTTIREYAFTCCGDLTAVTIPDSVMTIGAAAFSGCPMLEGIWVGENNPNYCSDENGVLFNKDKTELVAYPGALAGEYVIPDSITTIGDSAFLLCDKLIGITIPDGVTSIDANAFEHCYNLTDVVIPGSVKTIGEYAFVFCGGLTDIIIQEGVTTIGDGAFQSCYNLTDVTIPGSVSYIGATSFLNCGSLIDITIPEGVTTIGAMAFDSCYELSRIEIPVSVTYLGFDIFYDCSNLTDIYYGGSEKQWCAIDKDDNNFDGIAIHYNTASPGHDCPSVGFVDIPVYDNWAHNGIDYCVENELMNGVGNNLFSPNGTVSRAQLVTILYRVSGSPETAFRGTFTDVANGKWYSMAIEWAAANGVVNGVGDGKFAPDQSITREQIATILYRYHSSPTVSGNLNSFPDADSVSGFARNGLLWATQHELINGVSSNGVTSLAPKANATRAQIATIIMRYCEIPENPPMKTC